MTARTVPAATPSGGSGARHGEIRDTGVDHPGRATPGLHALRARLAAGAPVDTADLDPALERALSVARRTGAPLLPAFDAAVTVRDDEQRARRALDVATAQARVVARGLALAPPALVLLLGNILDMPLLAFYAGSAGRIVLSVGLGLLGVGICWSRLLIRRIRVDRSVVAEVADLVAVAMSAGLPAGAALRVAAEALPNAAPALRREAALLEMGHHRSALRSTLPTDVGTSDGAADLGDVVEVVQTASRWGAPAVAALRRLAADHRAVALSDALAAAERLPAQLTFPTALCLLPAALLLIGAPLVAEGLATVGGL